MCLVTEFNGCVLYKNTNKDIIDHIFELTTVRLEVTSTVYMYGFSLNGKSYVCPVCLLAGY